MHPAPLISQDQLDARVYLLPNVYILNATPIHRREDMVGTVPLKELPWPCPGQVCPAGTQEIQNACVSLTVLGAMTHGSRRKAL